MKNMGERVVWPALSTWMTERKTADPGRTRNTSSFAVFACWPGETDGGVRGSEGERGVRGRGE